MPREKEHTAVRGGVLVYSHFLKCYHTCSIVINSELRGVLFHKLKQTTPNKNSQLSDSKSYIPPLKHLSGLQIKQYVCPHPFHQNVMLFKKII